MRTRTPRRWAVLAVRAALVLLPPGVVRDRYRRELVAELWGMTDGAQLRYAVSTVAGAPDLHRALLEAGELDVPHSPVWCRMHLHHRWRVRRTPEGTPYRRCMACGTDDDGTIGGSSAGAGFGLTGVHPN